MERPDTLRRLCPSGLPILVRLAACRPPEEAELARCLAVGEGWLAEGRTGPESAALLLPYAADVAPARALRRFTRAENTRGGWVVVLGPMDGANLRACLRRAAVRWPAWQTWVVLPGARGLAAVFAAGFTLRRAGAMCGLPWAWLCNGRPVARRPGCEMALPLSEPGRIAARLEQGWVGADLRPGPAGENLLLYPAGPLL